MLTEKDTHKKNPQVLRTILMLKTKGGSREQVSQKLRSM